MFTKRINNRDGRGRCESGCQADLGVVVAECIDFLQDRQEEFLFRVPGKKEIVEKLQNRFESGETTVLRDSLGVTAHDVASLLKKYLTESPTALFSRSQANALFRKGSKVETNGPSATASLRRSKENGNSKNSSNSEKNRNSKNRLMSFKRKTTNQKSTEDLSKTLELTLNNLKGDVVPVANKLFPFLHQVSLDETLKMSARSLAVCFAPVLLLRHIDQEEKIPQYVGVATYICEIVIVQAQSIFPVGEMSILRKIRSLPSKKNREFAYSKDMERGNSGSRKVGSEGSKAAHDDWLRSMLIYESPEVKALKARVSRKQMLKTVKE